MNKSITFVLQTILFPYWEDLKSKQNLYTSELEEFKKLSETKQTYDYDLKELRNLNAVSGEFEELEKKRKIIKNFIKINETLSKVNNNFSSDSIPGIEKLASENIKLLNTIFNRSIILLMFKEIGIFVKGQRKRHSLPKKLDTSLDTSESKYKLDSLKTDYKYYTCTSCSISTQAWSSSKAAEMEICPNCLDKLIDEGTLNLSDL